MGSTPAPYDVDVGTQLPGLVSTVVSRGAVRGYDVALIGPLSDADSAPVGGGEFSTPGLLLNSIPERLRAVVEEPEVTATDQAHGSTGSSQVQPVPRSRRTRWVTAVRPVNS